MNFDKMSCSELETKLSQLAHEQTSLGWAYAEATAIAVGLEDRKNDMLAKYKSQVSGKTEAERERVVSCSETWTAYRDSIVMAKQDHIHAKIAYEVCVRTWETVRSIMSKKNTERRMA